MKHLRLVSRGPMPAQSDNLEALEQIILFLLSLFFSDWDNFQGVYQSLEKFYSKTP